MHTFTKYTILNTTPTAMTECMNYEKLILVKSSAYLIFMLTQKIRIILLALAFRIKAERESKAQVTGAYRIANFPLCFLVCIIILLKC